MSHAKTILRTIFYQYLALFIGLSIGFIINAEWVGFKSVIIQRSINNIFFPEQYSRQIEERIKVIGSSRVWSNLNRPSEFEILGDVVYANDEFYWCKYKYRDQNGELQFGEDINRIRWKTWEHNYEHIISDTPEKELQELKRMQNWYQKIREAINKADQREKEILEQEQKKKNKVYT